MIKSVVTYTLYYDCVLYVFKYKCRYTNRSNKSYSGDRLLNRLLATTPHLDRAWVVWLSFGTILLLLYNEGAYTYYYNILGIIHKHSTHNTLLLFFKFIWHYRCRNNNIIYYIDRLYTTHVSYDGRKPLKCTYDNIYFNEILDISYNI